MYLAITAIQAVTYAPLVNMFLALGEEVGWRGAMDFYGKLQVSGRKEFKEKLRDKSLGL